jgi:glycosyltransferase involved in cell wall biosynthesis
VEGHLGGGNDLALDNAVLFARALAGQLDRSLELQVVGDVPERFRLRWSGPGGIHIDWAGVVPRERIPEIDRSAHLFFSGELQAPCPNSVIEALACGLPVVAYDTGSLAELVRDGAGAVAPYGSDPWNLEPARPEALAQSAAALLQNLPGHRLDARARAGAAFSLDAMLDGYLASLVEE